MNKKEFMKNRPFDEVDAKQMQDWIESGFQDIAKNIYTSGIVEGLKVDDGPVGLQVIIKAGRAYDNSYNLIIIGADQTITLSAANTSPRIDVVTVKYTTSTVNNADTTDKYGQGTSFVYSKNILDGYTIEVIKGNPGASPVKPVIPAGNVELATVLVGANVTTLSQANITDTRAFVTLKNNVQEVYIGTSAPSNTNVIWIDTN